MTPSKTSYSNRHEKSTPPQTGGLMLEQLAHFVAKTMIESGVTDHATAKHKTARQLGSSDTQHLPDNDEIDLALKS